MSETTEKRDWESLLNLESLDVFGQVPIWSVKEHEAQNGRTWYLVTCRLPDGSTKTVGRESMVASTSGFNLEICKATAAKILYCRISNQ